MASAEHRLNMTAMRDMTGMAILNFFSANSKFFRSDVKNVEHLGAEDRTKEKERGTLVAAAESALGALYRFPAIYPPLFHLFLSLSTATGMQNCNTRICCHWNSSLFPVTSEWKFPLHFTKCRRKEKGKKCGGRGIFFFVCVLCPPFQRIKISVAVYKQNTYGSSEYLVHLLECRKGLNIFIYTDKKKKNNVATSKSYKQAKSSTQYKGIFKVTLLL